VKPRRVIYAGLIMPDRFLSPEQMDLFCRRVLPELADYRDAVAAGSLAAASLSLNKTPQAVGQGIKRLQNNLVAWLNNGTLTDRSLKKSVRTTEAGDLTFAFAEKLLADCDAFAANLHALQTSNLVRLACIHIGWMTYGPQIIDAFAKRVPGGTIDVQTIGGADYPQNIVAAVREGNADVGITSFPPKVSKPLLLQPLQDREMVLVFSAKYPKLPREKTVSLERVISRDESLKVAVHRRALNSPLGNLVVHYLKRLGADLGPSQLYEAQNVAEIRETIERIPGVISILPSDAADKESFRAYHLDPPLKPWTWGLIYRAGTSKRPMREFIECLRPLFKKTTHKKLSGS
jgi:DNA-binding transcriptional LysR family regulator